MSTVTLTYEPYYTISYPCNPTTSSTGQQTNANPPAWTQWTQAQEKTLANDYPFDVHATDPEDYLNRCYLQWLWLPESIMPLKLLIPSLRHLQILDSSHPIQEPHPMHTMLAPILRTTRTTSTKYHEDLVRVLSGNYNAYADMEEAMMWFAVVYEPHTTAKGKERDMQDDNMPWKDGTFRDKYLQKMERREALIQILLYMYKFSLPGPKPADLASSPKKRKRRASPSRGRSFVKKWSTTNVLDEPTLSEEDHLESFMDKLSMWQLMGELEPHNNTDSEINNNQFPVLSTGTTSSVRKGEKPRDWAQIFCEDIVEKEFKDKLPELCSLLRSKVFPNSVFSDDEEFAEPDLRATKPPPKRVGSDKAPTLTRKPSIPATTSHRSGINNNSRSLSRAPSNASLASGRALSRAPSRFPSPLPMDNDVQMTDGTSIQLSNASNTSNPSRRSRSLSLSQSLAQEQLDRERGTTLHASSNARKRGVLTREVSMSRSFKRKASGAFGESQDGLTAVKRDSKEKEEAIAREKEKERKKRELERGVTLVEETPVKKPRIEPARTEREQSSTSTKPLKALDLSAALTRGALHSIAHLQPPAQSTSRPSHKLRSRSPTKSPSLSPPQSPSPPPAPRTPRSRNLSPDIFLPPSSPPSNYEPSQASSQPPTLDLFSGNESPLTDFDDSSDEEQVSLQKAAATNKALDRVKTKSFKSTAGSAAPDDDDDDEWTIQSSPHITVLNPNTGKSTKISSLKDLTSGPSPLKGKSTTASDLMEVDEGEVETQLIEDGTTTEAEFSEETNPATSKTKGRAKPRSKSGPRTTKKKDAAPPIVEESGRQTPVENARATPSVMASPSRVVEVVIKTPKKPPLKRGRKK